MRKYEVNQTGTELRANIWAESAWHACVIISEKYHVAMSDLNAHAVN